MSEIPLELKIGCLIYVEVGQIAIWRAWARVDWKNVKKGIFIFRNVLIA